MRIGIFGGSFDPPHYGHEYVAKKLKQVLQLDEVWWVVTEINRMKPPSKHAYDERMMLVKKLVSKNKGMKTKEIPTSRAYEVVQYCFKRYPQHLFVWIGGSDNYTQIHRWYRWKDFCRLIPIIVLARPGYVYSAMRTPFATSVPRIELSHMHESKNKLYGWNMIRSKMHDIASTYIRNIQNTS